MKIQKRACHNFQVILYHQDINNVELWSIRIFRIKYIENMKTNSKNHFKFDANMKNWNKSVSIRPTHNGQSEKVMPTAFQYFQTVQLCAADQNLF